MTGVDESPSHKVRKGSQAPVVLGFAAGGAVVVEMCAAASFNALVLAARVCIQCTPPARPRTERHNKLSRLVDDDTILYCFGSCLVVLCCVCCFAFMLLLC